MPTVRELITKIAFRVERGRLQAAGASVGRVKKQMRATARQTRSLTNNINGMGVAMKAAAAAFIGSRILKVFTTGFSQGADDVAKFSKATGVATDFIQKFEHSMALGGATTKEVRNGIKKYTKVVRDAQAGLKTARRSFEDIGLDPDQVKADEEGLLQIADAFAGMKDEGTRAAIAQELFGKAGLKLIPGLKDGRAALKAYMDEAERLGIVLSKKQLQDAENFNDEMLRTKSVFIGVRNQIAAKLLPAITKNLVAFKEWATDGNNLAKALTTVKRAAIGATVAFVALKATKLGIAFAAALPALKTAAMLLMGVARAAAAAAAPLLLPIALIAALALAIEDLVGFAQGRDSLIGELFGDTAEGQEVKDLILEIGKTFKGMGKIFAEVRLEFLTLFKEIAKGLGKIILALLPAILRITIGLLRVVLWLTKALSWAVRQLVDGFNWVMDALSPVGDAFRAFGRVVLSVAQAIGRAFTVAIEGIGDGFVWLGEQLGSIWEGLKSGATAAANAIAAPFIWAGKKIKAGWDATVGKIGKVIDAIIDKIQTATNALAALTGQQETGTAVGAGLALFTAAGAKTVNTTNQTNVRLGQVSLTVQGSANMTPEQLEVAATKAFRRGMSDWASDLINARQPVVEGTTG